MKTTQFHRQNIANSCAEDVEDFSA